MNENSTYQFLFDFLKDFRLVYEKEIKKRPYHINLIDELRANENAHSRILQKLLNQNEPVSKKYEIFESFIQYIKEKYSKKDFKNIEIHEPIITQEEKRIDLWVRDNGKYAIVLENKVHHASDKDKQLERYIDETIKNGFDEKDIYVIYLPPTYEKEPSENSWGEYFEREIHKKRFVKISFKDDILPWLKNSLLPNIRLKDKYLSSAIEQYIDHLEGKFNLRTINNNMNMELQSVIKQKLEIVGKAPEESLKIIHEKKTDIEKALVQFAELEKQIKIEQFQKWNRQLHTDYKELTIIGNSNNPDTHINIGVKLTYNNIDFAILLEYNYNTIYYGTGIHYVSPKKEILYFSEVIPPELELILSEDSWWYAWKYTDFENGYKHLKELIETLKGKTDIQPSSIAK